VGQRDVPCRFEVRKRISSGLISRTVAAENIVRSARGLNDPCHIGDFIFANTETTAIEVTKVLVDIH
jgi:hypothetical protein